MYMRFDPMAVLISFSRVLILFLCLLHISGTSLGLMITFTSSCNDTIWPAIVSKPQSPELSKTTTGFALRPDESKTVSAPANWSGKVWGRTHCTKNATGEFTCGTGDCGSYEVDCPSGAAMPAATTLVDFSPNGGGAVGEYAYFVSVAMGFNLPISVIPKGNNIINYGGDDTGFCRATGCVFDMNKECPKEVEVMHGNDIVGCNSACEAFKESRYHYCGRSSTYSDHFKRFCPLAQAFENDKTNTLFTCSSADYYDVNFCASSLPSSPPPSASTLTSSPPPSKYYPRASPPPKGYSPGEEELTGDSGKSTALVIKIIVSIVGITGGGGLVIFLGHTILSLFTRDQQNCPLCILNLDDLTCSCCTHIRICNCCINNSPES